MASGDITTAQIGSAVPLAYGAVRATGMKLIDYTTSTNIIVQAYGLAEGEWDGIDSFFANGINIGQFSLNPSGVPARSGFFVNPNGTTTVHFHPGTDTPIGSSLTVPASVGTDIGDSEGDQLLDAMWSLIPAVVNPLTFSRLAYYFISFNPNVTSTGTAATTTSSTDLSPIADFRTTKCRIFDADGNQTDYRYTLNAAWHFVDSWLRRVIQPEYNITLSTSNPVTSIITPLTSSQRACFDWSSIAEAAAYYDYVLLNGRPRFQGSYAFASTTTLAAIHEQILLCCRSYQQEYAGKISLMCDKPRPSTFLFDERHLVPGTFTVDQQEVHGSANRYISNFLDLGLPVINTIATISRSGGSSGAPTAVITTTEETPAAAGDVFEVAGVTDATFDDIYTVTSASDSTIQAVPNYPQADASSTGGAIGYPETRFAARTPEINHRQAQLAAGQITSSATENATRLNRTQVTNDFASSTYDQQNRLLQYEMIRALGPDVAPWKPPATINVSAYSESIDDFDQVLKAQIPGDRITLTDRVTWEYAGDYEVMERYLNFFNWNETDPGSGAPDGKCGTIDLVLRSYEETRFVDVSDEPSASYATLPGESLWGGRAPVTTAFQLAYNEIVFADAGTTLTITVEGLQSNMGGGAAQSYADASLANVPYNSSILLYAFQTGSAINLFFELTASTFVPGPGIILLGALQTPQQGASSGMGSGSGSGSGNGSNGPGKPTPPGDKGN